MVDASQLILLIDDEPRALRAMELTLRSAGLDLIDTCSQAVDALEKIENNKPALIVLDLLMPEISGEMMLSRIKENYPGIPVIIATGVNEVETAVRCLRHGAHDYIVKPLERDRFLAGVNHALEITELRRENQALAQQHDTWNH